MKNTINEKAEKVKKNINGIAEKSKETIREIIAQNNEFANSAMESNSKIFKSIQKNLKEQEIEDSVTNALRDTILKSVELAEDSLDAIINSYTRQMGLTVDFNSKLVDAVKESHPENAEKFLDLIHENFEATHQLTVRNTKEILDFYNKHTNLALNFNQKFGDIVNSQIDLLFQVQNKSLSRFTNWATEWLKQSGGIEKTV